MLDNIWVSNLTAGSLTLLQSIDKLLQFFILAIKSQIPVALSLILSGKLFVLLLDDYKLFNKDGFFGPLIPDRLLQRFNFLAVV